MTSDRDAKPTRKSRPRSKKQSPQSTYAILQAGFQKPHRVSGGNSKAKRAGLDIALDQVYAKAMAGDPKAIEVFMSFAAMTKVPVSEEPVVRVVADTYQPFVYEWCRKLSDV